MIEEDVEKILALKISSKAEVDLLGWHYTDDGIYTVKSGYWLSTHLPNREQAQPIWGDPVIKQKVWKCNTPPKLNHFLWRLLSRSLAVGSNLKRRHITSDDQCKRCCNATETETHLFFDCPYAQRIWRASGISNLTILSTQTTLEDKVDVCLSCNISTRLPHLKDLPISILWRIWKSRNILLYQQKTINWWNVLEQAKRDAKEWSINRTAIQLSRNSNTSEVNGTMENIWKRPAQGWVKCNFDGSFVSQLVPSKAGWVIRNERSTYQGAGQGRGFTTTPLEAEFQALIMAMQQCWCRGFTKVIFERDNKKMFDILNGNALHFGVYNWTREVRWWSTKFEEITFRWTKRTGNEVADKLAKANIPNDATYTYYFYIPHFITTALHKDFGNSIH